MARAVGRRAVPDQVATTLQESEHQCCTRWPITKRICCRISEFVRVTRSSITPPLPPENQSRHPEGNPHDRAVHLLRHWRVRLLPYGAEAALVGSQGPGLRGQGSGAPRDHGAAPSQSAEDAALQQAHLASIHDSGEHYRTFTGPINLVLLVFDDSAWTPKANNVSNLPYRSIGSLFKGREGFLKKVRQSLLRIEQPGHQSCSTRTNYSEQ